MLQGQGAITEKLRSLSMHDLTQINQQDDGGGNQLYHFSSHSANPAVRRSQSTDAAEAGMCTSSQSQTQIEAAILPCCAQAPPAFGEPPSWVWHGLTLLLDVAPSDNNQHHFPLIKRQTVFAKLFPLFSGPTSGFSWLTVIQVVRVGFAYLGNCPVENDEPLL